MLTFNKLAEIFSNLDPGVRGLGLVVPMIDEDGKVISFQALSGNIVQLCEMRELRFGGMSVGKEVPVILLGPNNFKPEEHIDHCMIQTYYLE